MGESVDDARLCIGLFGTCGGSRWREEHFIPRYDELGIRWYNPQVDDWDPGMAKEEADHLANDAIILFPVTSETYGFGSLAETGFSMLHAIRLDDRRDFVIYIEQAIAPLCPKGNALDDSLLPDGGHNPASRARESLRTRAIVQHLVQLCLQNVYVVDSLEEMFRTSVTLWDAAKLRWPLRRHNPHRTPR